MSDTREVKIENTFTFSGKPEHWRLAHKKLQAKAKQNDWMDALDKNKVANIIGETEYKTLLVIPEDNRSDAQKKDIKLYEDNESLINVFILGLKATSEQSEVILQKLEDTATDDHPDGILYYVVEELNEDIQINEEVGLDIILSKMEKVEFESSAQYKREVDLLAAKKRIAGKISDKDKLKNMRKAIARTDKADKKALIKDIMEELEETIPSFKKVCRKFENMEELAEEIDDDDDKKSSRKKKDIQMTSADDEKKGGYYKGYNNYRQPKKSSGNSREPQSNWNGGRQKVCPHCKYRNPNHTPEACFKNPTNRGKSRKAMGAREAKATSVDIQMNKIDIPIKNSEAEELKQSEFSTKQEAGLNSILESYDIKSREEQKRERTTINLERWKTKDNIGNDSDLVEEESESEEETLICKTTKRVRFIDEVERNENNYNAENSEDELLSDTEDEEESTVEEAVRNPRVRGSENNFPQGIRTTKSGRRVAARERLIEHMQINAETRGVTAADVHYLQRMMDTNEKEFDFMGVGAGVGGGFDNTAELHVLTYKQAMKSEDREEWKKEVKKEKERFDKNNVLTAKKRSEIPKGTKVMTSTWAMKKKSNGKYRGRPNLRGFQQRDGEHFVSISISSPVTNETSVRIAFVMLALCPGWIVYRLITSLGLDVELPMILEMDNKGAVDLANNWSVGGRTRHVDVRNFYLRELKDEGYLLIKHVPGDDNGADIFTKNTPYAILNKHIKKFVGEDEYTDQDNQTPE